MGRRGKGRGGKTGSKPKPSTPWSEESMQNERMSAYYRAQAILPEEEFEEHLAAFRRPLPTTFRITGSRESATMVRNYMERTFFPYLSGKSFEGKALKEPEAISWYPDGLAYKIDVPKQAIRKSPDFKAFQKFLVMESESGNLVRQEVVSMVPPLLMNIKHDSVCLDMCAAPGSKTSQMLEYLHRDTAHPTGLVLANDSDFKRAYMLVHQVKRLNSPNFVVTNHDATFLANFHDSEEKRVQKFDCVLADVPCSGDGTLRKNYEIWKNWKVSAGLSLHPTQVNCLRRGLQMLRVGGRLVYSTCSLNPIENEAVLHAVLSTINGAAHLVDVSAELPSLKRRPGLHTWKPTDSEGNFISSIDDVKKDKHRFPTSIFPPSAESARVLHLERALRVYPHLGDTGGFFVAVIDKTAEITADFESVRFKANKRHVEDSSPDDPQKQTMKRQRTQEADSQDAPAAAQVEETEANDLLSLTKLDETALPHEIEQVIPKPRFMKSLNDEYFKFLPQDHPDLNEITNSYGLSDTFDTSCFLSRNISGEPVRSLYYTSPLVKKLLVHNEGRVKFVHAGVKIFQKQNIESLKDGSRESQDVCKWRVAQDGVQAIKDYVRHDKFVTCNVAELTIFMMHEYPRASLFPDQDNVESVISQLNTKPYGCYILRCDLSKAPESNIPELIEVPLWKSKVTIQMMIARKEKEAIYNRITGQELPAAVKLDRDTKSTVVDASGADDMVAEEVESKLAEQGDAVRTIEESGQN